MYMRYISRLYSAMAKPRPVVISGPSGAGKSTLLQKLMKEYEGVFGFSVSLDISRVGAMIHVSPLGATSLQDTTRNPRPGEVDGKDYHFVTREVMQAGIDNSDFIESAVFSGNMYGTSKAAVQDVQSKNLICILDIDMQGVKSIKKTDLEPLYISIQPPSMEAVEKRLRARKTETDESLQRRLCAACADMEFSKEPGVFNYIVINDDLEEAYGQLKDALIEDINKVKNVTMSS